MHKKITTSVVVVVAVAMLVIAGVVAYQKMIQPSVTETQANGPVFEGALVNIASTTLTLKADSGEEKSFICTPSTVITSQESDGGAGIVFAQLSVGDVMSVTAQAKNPTMAKAIEIMPAASSTPTDATAFILTGTILERNATSTTILLATNDPVLALTPTKISIATTKETQFLTLVASGQIGKPESALATGQLVRIYGYEKGAKRTATRILLVR